MFDRDRRYDREYIDTEPVREERKRVRLRDITPMWALPLLLIPLALLVWGGSVLLRNNNAADTRALTQDAQSANQSNANSNNGIEMGVGGSGDTRTPTLTPSKTATATATPKGEEGTEVGVGGGPDEDVEGAEDTVVPSAPQTGHGW